MTINNKPFSNEVLAEMLYDRSIDRVIAINTDWEIIAWNKTTEIITGIKRNTVFNKPLLDVFPGLGADNEWLQAVDKCFQGLITFLPSKPGAANRHYYENHFIPLKDDDGAVFGVMNIMHDVAHRVKEELQLEKLSSRLTNQYLQLQKANAELVTFTNITGNDIKEPLKKAYSSLETVARADGPLLSDTSKAALRRVQSSLNRVNLLLEDILALANANTNGRQFTQVKLDIVLAEAVEILHEKIAEKQARIEAEKLPVIYGNAQMMQYLFVNLLDNALKFQPEGNVPVINITARHITGNTRPGVVTGQEKKYVCIYFKDNGIGFKDSEAEQIFNMFERLHPRNRYGGSGIGLTICQKIAEAHGGYMEAKGQEGMGSTFTCVIGERGDY